MDISQPAKGKAFNDVSGEQLNIKKPRISLVTRLCILLAIISCIVYANTLQNGYAFDDGLVVSENAIVKQGIKAIPELLATPHLKGRVTAPNDMYRPLSLVMFAVEYELAGLNPFVGHLMNILIFAACVLLLFTFLDKLFDREKTVVAFIAALLFAVHPIHTEVVANIKSRDELLCFFFAFLSLQLYMSYMKKGNVAMLLSGSFTLFLSYLSKETVITFLAIIPLIFFSYYAYNRKRAILISIGTVIVTALFIGIRAYVLNKYNANQSVPLEFMDNPLSHPPSLAYRIATAIVILGKYIRLMFIPYPLFSIYSYNSIPFVNFSNIAVWCILAACDFLVYIVITRWTKNGKDPLVFGILFFFITIFLFSNIPFLMGAEMAERFTFFPSVGFCLIVALAIEEWMKKLNITGMNALKSIKLWLVLAPVVVVFSSMSIARNADWKNNYSLFKGDAIKSGNDSRLYLYAVVTIMNDSLSQETDSARRNVLQDECIVYLRKAVSIYPGYPNVYDEMGAIYEQKHIQDSADMYERKALETGLPDAIKYNDAGNKYFTNGRYEMAVYCFKKSISIRGDVKFPYFTLGCTYAKMRQYDSAISYFHKTLSLDTGYVAVLQNMAIAYYSLQNFDSAEHYLKRVVALAPDNPNSHNGLGILYFNIKKYEQAVEQFKYVIAKNEHNIDAWSMAGLSYFKMEKYDSAIIAFNKEIIIDPNATRDLSYLALAYQHTGDMTMAAKYEAITRQYQPDFRLK